MPLYSLLCKDCDKVIERICKMSEVVKCRKCGKSMSRLPVQTTFILKGGGWAKDSYIGRAKI